MEFLKNIIKFFFKNSNQEEQTNLIDYAPALENYYNDRNTYSSINCDEIWVSYRSPFFPFEGLIFHDKFKELKEIIFRKPPKHCTDNIRVDFRNKGERIDCYATAGCYWRDIEELYNS